jgi:hypothetical protein
VSPTDTEVAAPPPYGVPPLMVREATTTLPSTIAESRASATNTLPPSISANWGKIAKARMTHHMYANLLRVAAANLVLGSRKSALNATSLADFFDFWARIRVASAEPEFALAPDGTLSAEWFKSQRQRLDVQFVGRKVIFGLIANNNILEGADNLQTVAALLKSHPSKPLQWKVE